MPLSAAKKLLLFRSPFTPASIAGLQLWLDASDPATLFQDSALTTLASSDTNPVGGWTDKSGLVHNMLQATAGKRPLLKKAIVNGLSVLRFDGSDDFLKATFTLNQPHSIYMVYSSPIIGAAGVHDVVLDGAVNEASFESFNAPATQLYAGSTVQVASNVANNVFAVLSILFNGNTSFLRQNGVGILAGGAGIANPGGFTLGGTRTGARNTQIDVAYVLIYSTIQGAVDRATIERALGARFGIGVN